MLKTLTPAKYNAYAGSGAKINGSEGLGIFVNSGATADEFKEYLEMINKIHNNDTSLGTPVPGWPSHSSHSSHSNVGKSRAQPVHLPGNQGESAETQGKLDAAMSASLGELKDDIRGLGITSAASVDAIRGLGITSASNVDAIRGLGITSASNVDAIQGLRITSVASVNAIRAFGEVQGKMQSSLDRDAKIKESLQKSQDALRLSQQGEANTKEALMQCQQALYQSQALHSEDKDKNGRQTYKLNDLNKQLTELRAEKAKVDVDNAKLRTELAGLRNLQVVRDDIRTIKAQNVALQAQLAAQGETAKQDFRMVKAQGVSLHAQVVALQTQVGDVAQRI